MNKINDNPDIEECKALIRNHPFFALFTPDDIDQFASQMKKMTFEPGEIVIRENTLVSWIFLIAKGKAEIQRIHSTMQSTRVLEMGTLTAGDSIGLSDATFFSTTGFRTASIIAVTAVTIYGISFLDFYHFLRFASKRYPALTEAGEKIVLINFIANSHLFSDLSPDKIAELSECMKKISVPKNTIIFAKNEPADKAYYVLTGKVIIFEQDAQQNETLLAELMPGELFGESSLLSKGVRHEWARSLTDCELFCLSRKNFRQFIKNNRTFYSMLKNFHASLTSDYEDEHQSLFHSLFHRLKSFFKERK